MARATLQLLREPHFRACETGGEGASRPASTSGFFPDLEAPRCWRWENAGARRYYEARVTQGLFGEWYVLRSWGGIGTRFGGEQADLVTSPADAITVLEVLAKRRVQRGYLAVPRA